METHHHAVVGIAGHFDSQNRQGGWAVVVRVDGRELGLHGFLPGVRAMECERHATKQAILALRRLRAPLDAIEVTLGVKQALVPAHFRGPHAHNWAPAREWWKSVAGTAGIRVTRKPGDAYSAACRMAQIAAISGLEKLKLTDEELNTPWNREHRARQAARRIESEERRADRAAAKEESDRRREKVNEYAIAKGRESPPPWYRPRPGRVAPSPSPPPRVAAATTGTLDLGAMTVEALLASLGGT